MQLCKESDYGIPEIIPCCFPKLRKLFAHIEAAKVVIPKKKSSDSDKNVKQSSGFVFDTFV